ncbi:MAG: hypothetical protein H0T42_16935 [Deltaproteobacteria bacterium]|nr:hypothetical protein [Deltaproteobacteria bacterium]
MSAYDDAVAELYQAPHGSFVAERKRLAGELKAAGDKASAARFAKLGRPTISAWAVNQLWWHAHDAFETLFETAAKLRKGGLAASGPHREAIAKLRARAARILGDAGHAATEGTLRKVTQTLAALAATGSWDPDPAGTISADRDPPGFEAIGIVDVTPPPVPANKAAAKESSRDELADLRKRKAIGEAAEREEAAADRKRIEVDRARIKVERHRLEAALRTTRGEAAAQEREVEKLRKQLGDAEDNLAQAQAVAKDLQAKLDELDH